MVNIVEVTAMAENTEVEKKREASPKLNTMETALMESATCRRSGARYQSLTNC